MTCNYQQHCWFKEQLTCMTSWSPCTEYQHKKLTQVTYVSRLMSASHIAVPALYRRNWRDQGQPVHFNPWQSSLGPYSFSNSSHHIAYTALPFFVVCENLKASPDGLTQTHILGFTSSYKRWFNRNNQCVTQKAAAKPRGRATGWRLQVKGRRI